MKPNRLRPQMLLAIFVGLVPLVVLLAGVVAFLLLRAGSSIFVWAMLPLLGSLVIVGILGFVLGRAAGGRGRTPEEKPHRENNV